MVKHTKSRSVKSCKGRTTRKSCKSAGKKCAFGKRKSSKSSKPTCHLKRNKLMTGKRGGKFYNRTVNGVTRKVYVS